MAFLLKKSVFIQESTLSSVDSVKNLKDMVLMVLSMMPQVCLCLGALVSTLGGENEIKMHCSTPIMMTLCLYS